MPDIAARLNNLPPYPFAVLNQRVRELNNAGFDIVNLDIGSPDMPPSDLVIKSMTDAISDPTAHGYSGYKGTAEFRAGVARYYERRFGVILDPEKNVLPLLGSKEGIVNLSLAFLDQGDIALVPEIAYPAYQMGAHLAGAQVQWVKLDVANGFLPDLDALAADFPKRAKLLWINYPNNPTGATCDFSTYQKIVDFCRERNLLLASDNPYVEVTFDGYVAGSVLQVAGALDTTVEFISWSKSYNMAGWRLGAAVGSAEALKTLLVVKSNMDSGHFHAIYKAGITASDETPRSWIDARNLIYEKRRDKILAALPDMGLVAKKTSGSLYVWARTEMGNGSQFAEAALTQAHVSVAPGVIYGPGGTPYIRMSLGIPDDRLDEALSRLKSWYGKR